MSSLPCHSFFNLVALGPESPYKEKLMVNMNLSKHSVDELKLAFKAIDRNSNGFIEADEVRYLLAVLYKMKNPPEEEIKLFIDKFDKNKDGKVTFQEFVDACPEIMKKVSKDTKENYASTSVSSHELLKRRKKQERDAFGPRQKYVTPVTCSQNIGWQALSKAEKNKNDPHMPKKSCQETVFASEMIASGIYF